MLSVSSIHVGISRWPCSTLPDIDVVWVLNEEHEVRIVRQRPDAQPGQIEFVGVTRKAGGRMATDVSVSLFQCINETKRDTLACFVQIVCNCIIDIPVGLLTRDDRLTLHACGAGLAALRTRSRSPSK